jgi:hypothetical protein
MISGSLFLSSSKKHRAEADVLWFFILFLEDPPSKTAMFDNSEQAQAMCDPLAALQKFNLCLYGVSARV